MEKDVDIDAKAKKNIFIVTFGTSDIEFNSGIFIQEGFILERVSDTNPFIERLYLFPIAFPEVKLRVKSNRNRKDSYVLHSPREDGLILVQQYSIFGKIANMSITLPVLNKIVAEGKKPDSFVLIYTDQEDVAGSHRSNDSLYIASVFKAKVKTMFESYGDEHFIEMPIKRNLTLIDEQYRNFASKCKQILETPIDEIGEIFLLPQGGIDQINQALTLQFIKAFKNKVKLYQKPEDAEPKQLEFTNLFLLDLLKQQVISLINSGEYQAASILLRQYQNKLLSRIAQLLEFADKRKLFLYKEALKIKTQAGSVFPDFIIYDIELVQESDLVREIGQKKAAFNILERFFLAEFYYSAGNYTQFVLSFQIFYERLIGYYLSNKYNLDLEKKYYDHGSKLLKNICQTEKALYGEIQKKLRLKVNEEVKLSLPTLAMIAIHCASRAKKDTVVQKLLEIFSHINSVLNGSNGGNGIDKLRNRIAHDGIGVMPEDLYVSSNEKDKHDRFFFWNKYIKAISEILGNKVNPYHELNDYVTRILEQ